MEMKLAASLNRLGTETAFSVLAEAKKLEAKGHPMIHLGLGQPDFKTPKHVVDAAKKALDDGHHGYVMSNGIPECRQACLHSGIPFDITYPWCPSSNAFFAASTTCFGVLKSGCPSPRWIMG